MKQGTVLGPVLNNCSVNRIRGDNHGHQMGHAFISPKEIVDDSGD